MRDKTRRIWFYGTAAVVLGGLIYGGFVYGARPGVGTLLSSADIQLRLAHGIPALDADGRPVAARCELLDQAEVNLEGAMEQAPDSPIVAEFQGFLRQLRGDWRGAAGEYRRARTLPACRPDQRDTLIFNEARALDRAGDPAAALAVFMDCGGQLQERFVLQQAIEEVGLLRQLGRGEEALQRLQRAAASDEPVAWLQAALGYEDLGRADLAVGLLGRAVDTIPVAQYHLARLKLLEGDVDISLKLLESAAKAVPAAVSRLVRMDEDVWQVVAEDERFRQLVAPATAAPGR